MRTNDLFFNFLLAFALFTATNRALASPPPELTVHSLANRLVQLTWPATAAGFALEQTDALGAIVSWSVVAQAPVLAGGQLAVTLDTSAGQKFFRLHAPLVTIAQSSPLNGETGVAVTRETIVHFSAPLATNAVVTTDNFFAGFGGRRVLSRVELSSDRKKASLFYLEPLPGSARVVAVFDGAGLTDVNGLALDADGDGVPGGQAIIAFDTLNLTALAGTAVVGKVFASELVPGADTGTNAVNQPLAGVTITVDGMEQTLRDEPGGGHSLSGQVVLPVCGQGVGGGGGRDEQSGGRHGDNLSAADRARNLAAGEHDAGYADFFPAQRRGEQPGAGGREHHGAGELVVQRRWHARRQSGHRAGATGSVAGAAAAGIGIATGHHRADRWRIELRPTRADLFSESAKPHDGQAVAAGHQRLADFVQSQERRLGSRGRHDRERRWKIILHRSWRGHRAARLARATMPKGTDATAAAAAKSMRSKHGIRSLH
ncbi:MAG: Ig-like domain-containing protein [Verrucomicrobia bacterium]|nr:Ig-like domain-containing protein [Verrucomicrobiota bacterium]